MLTTLTMLGLNYHSTDTVIELEQEEVLLRDVEAGMLMLRRNEKDFLMRKDMKYLDKFNANHEMLLSKTRLLAKNLEGSGINSEKAHKVLSVMSAYAEDFRALVNAQQKIGLHSKDGLYGSLRKAVHSVEQLIKEQANHQLLSDMLMLRRNEKDFMLRDDLKYRQV